MGFAVLCSFTTRGDLWNTHISNSTYNALSLHPQEQTQVNIVYGVNKYQYFEEYVAHRAEVSFANCQSSVTMSPQCQFYINYTPKGLCEFAIFLTRFDPPSFEHYSKKLHNWYRAASLIWSCSVRTSVSLPGNIVGIVSQVA